MQYKLNRTANSSLVSSLYANLSHFIVLECWIRNKQASEFGIFSSSARTALRHCIKRFKGKQAKGKPRPHQDNRNSRSLPEATAQWQRYPPRVTGGGGGGEAGAGASSLLASSTAAGVNRRAMEQGRGAREQARNRRRRRGGPRHVLAPRVRVRVRVQPSTAAVGANGSRARDSILERRGTR